MTWLANAYRVVICAPTIAAFLFLAFLCVLGTAYIAFEPGASVQEHLPVLIRTAIRAAAVGVLIRINAAVVTAIEKA